MKFKLRQEDIENRKSDGYCGIFFGRIWLYLLLSRSVIPTSSQDQLLCTIKYWGVGNSKISIADPEIPQIDIDFLEFSRLIKFSQFIKIILRCILL